MNRKLPLSDEELEIFESTRDLEAELVQAIAEMNAGLGTVILSDLIQARLNTGLPPAEFAALLGVSPETLEDWEQRRAQPTGAARIVLKLALDHPELVLAAAK